MIMKNLLFLSSIILMVLNTTLFGQIPSTITHDNGEFKSATYGRMLFADKSVSRIKLLNFNEFDTDRGWLNVTPVLMITTDCHSVFKNEWKIVQYNANKNGDEYWYECKGHEIVVKHSPRFEKLTYKVFVNGEFNCALTSCEVTRYDK